MKTEADIDLISRRKVVAGGLGSLAVPSAQAKCPDDPRIICNVTQLYSVKVTDTVQVKDADDIRNQLKRWSGQVCVGGGRFSMGGQTAISSGMQLDMRTMNQMVWFNPHEKTIRVQSGMTWRDVQEIIAPHGLSVQTMQSYANFTVGGSVSVNCHGRYVGHGAIVNSIRALQMVLPHGEVIEISQTQSPQIFYAAIGGYGGLGIITEVELNLDVNQRIKRVVEQVPLKDYIDWFKQTVQNNDKALLHNADLTPPTFDAPLATTWFTTESDLTVKDPLTPKDLRHHKEKLAIWTMTEVPGAKALRKSFDRMRMQENPVVWRNFEASLDVGALEPFTRQLSTYVLQEYFVPERHFQNYVTALSKLMKSVPSNTLNISIRQARADRNTVMAWAREDVFTFVVYYKQRTHMQAQQSIADWTRAMIDLALKYQGSYYLPYQLHATQQQFLKAYPQALAFKKLRQELQSQRLTNMLWHTYNI